ncbi:MAG: hypothetical protein OIN66_05635 [Candidatus Methanoperedens sp.]|nr:hypothetical protein [Candidatus Methanoperedens sp.]
MKKMSLEIITAVGSVVVFIILTIASRLIAPGSAGYGYAAALLIFIVIMGFTGLKLAEIPGK